MQIVINPCLVAVILKEDCCGTIVAELGTLMMVGSSDWLFCVIQVTIVFDQIKPSQVNKGVFCKAFVNPVVS